MRWMIGWARRVYAVAGVATVAAGSLSAQMTTGAVRGQVMSGAGEPVAEVEVIVTNVATGVAQRTRSNSAGRYAFPALVPGTYRVQARRLGWQILERANVRVHLGESTVVSFSMAPAAAALEAVTVTVEANPLIDPDQTGVVDLIDAEQIQAIPVSGRNFADLVALSPKVGFDVGDGTGGALSLGGGRRGANLIQIDGAGTTGTFFGGEARGSDRIPFAFSIETVQEFQVVTNDFDVEFGFFSGGVINAVTKSGTNQFQGSLFGYFRNDAYTRDDFFGRTPDFASRQIGGTLSGPLIRNKLHFFVAVERQDRDEPVFGLPSIDDVPDINVQRVHPDSVARFLDILQNVYGIQDATGQFRQNQDELSIFARIDWQINNAHRLTLRHNNTDLEQVGDQINPDETILNGGVFNNTSNSTVLELNSLITPAVWNQFRFQVAFEPRPRTANTLLPQAEVNVSSDFDGDGISDASLRGLECCNDAVLPNNLEETTIELTNNLHIRTQNHDIKLGVQFNYFDFENFFFFNQQGQFDFNSLSDFENGIVDDFRRNLPNPGPDGLFFTADDVNPIALYQTSEFSFYAQDTWHVNEKLAVTGGLRIDLTRFADAAPLNSQLVSDFGLSTDFKPSDTNLSPRISFAYDMMGDGSTVVRGGFGLFFGRFPSVLYSNSLLNTGGNQVSLFCGGDPGDVDAPPAPDYQSFANDLSTIPTACAGGAAATPPTPDINLFSPDFEYPRTWKVSFGLEHAITSRLKVDLDFLYATTDRNFYVTEQNLLPQQFTSGIENRPVFCPDDSISGGGECGRGDNRLTANFDEVLLHESSAESRTYQMSIALEQRGRRFSWQAGYTYSDSKDNASYSCCISGTAQFETPTAGSPNNLGGRGDVETGTWGPSDFSRPHTFVLSGIANLPRGFSVGGIWRATSGRPWTPVVSGDVNGDAQDDNDRAFISNTLNFANPGDGALLDSIIAAHDCLKDEVGRIARRNSCRNATYTQLDLRVRWQQRIRGSHTLEVIADVFNVLNLINNDWSRNVGVRQFEDERFLLQVEGFDRATQTYTYSVNPSFAEKQDLTAFRTDQGSLQIGVKYSF